MALENNQDVKADGGLWETAKVIIHALILALIVRTFLFQPFNIPSGSMKSTLLIGDYLFVSKFSYGYSRYSIPFGYNLFSGRVWAEEPKRGDVIVFKLPRDNSTDYIKRLIGLPGDRIQMIDGVLHINGEAIKKEYVDTFFDAGPQGYNRAVERYRETLPNGVVYEVLDATTSGQLDNTQEFTVPPGHYFMMGDNRDNSTDSRVSISELGVGFVPAENLIGRAEIIFFSLEDGARFWEFWRWPTTIRWGRLFRLID